MKHSSEDCMKARRAIQLGIDDAESHALPGILCAVYGHPPVVKQCFGQVNCARCDEILGDMLAGVYSIEGKMLVGHSCPKCDAIRAALTPEQRLLTKLVNDDG